MRLPVQPAFEGFQPRQRRRLIRAGRTGQPAGARPPYRMHHLAQRQRAESQMRRQARTVVLAAERAGHAAAVARQPLGQEGVQLGQRLPATGALATGDVSPGHAERHRVRRGLQTFQRMSRRFDVRRRRQRRRRHARQPEVGPAVAVAQPAHHAAIRAFMPGHAVGEAPVSDRAVAREAGQRAGLFVAPQRADRRRTVQRVQYRRHVAAQLQQRQPQRAQRAGQVVQRLAQEARVARIHLRLREQ